MSTVDFVADVEPAGRIFGACPIDCSQVAHAAVGDPGLASLLQDLFPLLESHFEFDWLRVCLAGEEDRLRVRLIADAAGATAIAGPPPRAGFAEKVARTGTPFAGELPDPNLQAQDGSSLSPPADIRVLAAAPLQFRKRLIGTVEIGRTGPAGFTPQEVSRLFECATCLATAIEQFTAREEQRALAKIEERGRIAGQIHAAVVEPLIRAVLHLELAERRLRSNPVAAGDEISQAKDLARQCLDEVRQALLEPEAAATAISFRDAIMRQLSPLRASGTDVRLSFEGSPSHVPEAARLSLLQLADEVVSAIKDQAGADSVRTVARFAPEEVQLEIEYDGTPLQHGAGNGEAVERARLLGADLSVSTLAGNLNRLLIRVPTRSDDDGGLAQEATPANPVQVLIVDDQTLFRQGLRQILEQSPDLKVVAEATSAQEALDATRSRCPDVVLLDVQSAGADAADFIATLTQDNPGTRVLVISSHTRSDLVVEAIAAGASGYLGKNISGSALADAIRSVHRGEMLLHPTARAEFAAGLNGMSKAPRDVLSEREKEVLELIASGRRNKEIARELSLTEATIKYHVTHLLDKLGVGSRTEAIVRAQRLGLLSAQLDLASG